MMKKITFLLVFCVGAGYLAHAADSAKKSTVSADVLDKTRRKNAYDGFEITDNKLKIKVPGGKADLAFTLREFENNKFIKLKGILGEPGFQKIIKTQGYIVPKTEFESFRGEDKLPLYYYIRPDKQKGTTTLILVSYGEYQPSRYILHIEGIWRIKGATF